MQERRKGRQQAIDKRFGFGIGGPKASGSLRHLFLFGSQDRILFCFVVVVECGNCGRKRFSGVCIDLRLRSIVGKGWHGWLFFFFFWIDFVIHNFRGDFVLVGNGFAFALLGRQEFRDCRVVESIEGFSLLFCGSERSCFDSRSVQKKGDGFVGILTGIWILVVVPAVGLSPLGSGGCGILEIIEGSVGRPSHSKDFHLGLEQPTVYVGKMGNKSTSFPSKSIPFSRERLHALIKSYLGGKLKIECTHQTGRRAMALDLNSDPRAASGKLKPM